MPVIVLTRGVIIVRPVSFESLPVAIATVR